MRVTDLEEFSLDQIWRPYWRSHPANEVDQFGGDLRHAPFDLSQTALQLVQPSEWSGQVIRRLASIGVRFPDYIRHPLVEVITAKIAQAEPNRAPLPNKPEAVTVGRVPDGAPFDADTVLIRDEGDGQVEFWDVRPGDMFHVSLLVADVDEGAIIDIPKDWQKLGHRMFEVPFEAAASITRPPIPKDPGSRADAKVRGRTRALVVRSSSSGDTPWISSVPVDGHTWHADSDLTDYVPLLDGQDQ